MSDRAIPVAVGLVRHGEEILLIRRVRGDYVGMWALPGGKIEADEHLHDAVLRELREETGLDLAFESYLGVVSEVFRSGQGTKHFLLHICSLRAFSAETENTGEGDSAWFRPGDLQGMKDDMVPSDYEIIRNFLLLGRTGYYACAMSDSDGRPVLEGFSSL